MRRHDLSEASSAASAAHGRSAGKGDLEVRNAVRVLVVEDEAPICSFIEDALSDGGFEGGFNRSSQHFMYGSLGEIRREFPLVFSSQGFSGAWC